MPVSVPLRGVGCFRTTPQQMQTIKVSVPLRGVGCFPDALKSIWSAKAVSVPLRGVGCFLDVRRSSYRTISFRPLAGCGLFHVRAECVCRACVSVPLRGVGCFKANRAKNKR